MWVPTVLVALVKNAAVVVIGALTALVVVAQAEEVAIYSVSIPVVEFLLLEVAV